MRAIGTSQKSLDELVTEALYNIQRLCYPLPKTLVEGSIVGNDVPPLIMERGERGIDLVRLFPLGERQKVDPVKLNDDEKARILAFELYGGEIHRLRQELDSCKRALRRRNKIKKGRR